MKQENLCVAMLSLMRKQLCRGIIKQRGTQMACEGVLNSERFIIPREGQKLPFHVLQWGRRAGEDPRYPVSPPCQGPRPWGSLPEPYRIHIHKAASWVSWPFLVAGCLITW